MTGTPDPGSAEGERRARRIQELTDQLDTARTELRTAQRDLARARADLAAMRRRRAVRVATAFADQGRRLLPMIRPLAAVATRLTRGGRKQAPGRGAERQRRATVEDETKLLARIAASIPPSDAAPTLSASLVLTEAPGAHLQAWLDAARTPDAGALEVIVVDGEGVEATGSIVMATTELGRAASTIERRRAGAAIAHGSVIVFANGLVRPARADAITRLLARLEQDPTIDMVTGRHIHPRRIDQGEERTCQAADLSVAQDGLTFDLLDGAPVVSARGHGSDPVDVAPVTGDLPAATGCIAVRASAWARATAGSSADGLAADLDLSLRVRSGGGRIALARDAIFWQRHDPDHLPGADGRWDLARPLLDEWGPELYRSIVLDQIDDLGAWSDARLRVAITVTKDDPAAGRGDWHTAHELGDALVAIGWDVSYLERWEGRWYEPGAACDVVIALLDSFDIRRLPRGVISIAWVRNWTDRWLEQPWFDRFDLVFASSQASKELIDQGSTQVAELMPIATNPDRFIDMAEAPTSYDVVFTGNHWGEARGVEDVLPPLSRDGRSVAVFGRDWDKVDQIAPFSQGTVEYDRLPEIYGRAGVVLDVGASPTLPYGSVNSRVFDALASGTLVVSNNVSGTKELFGDSFPSAADEPALVALIRQHLDDPAGRSRLARRFQTVVLGHHTYAHRAEQIRAALRRWASATRIDILIGPPDHDVAPSWGDTYFGGSLRRVFEGRGYPTRLRILPEWDEPSAATADVSLHLFGLKRSRVRIGQIAALWIISHPDQVTDELLADRDIVFVAGDGLADRLARRTGRPVIALHQATDPQRFRPGLPGPHHDILFVANSRKVRRRVIDDLLPTAADLAVYGRDWTPDLLEPTYVKGEFIPNDRLAGYYASASIVLNDHWPDMAEAAFFSNRLYDAAASGAFVISDHVDGIEAEFDGGIVSYTDGSDLRLAIDRYLADPAARAERAARARTAVLDRHTFAHRATTILESIEPLLGRRRAGPSTHAGPSKPTGRQGADQAAARGRTP